MWTHPVDKTVWVSSACLQNEAIESRKSQSQFSDLFNVVLPISHAQSEATMLLEIPTAELQNVPSFLPSISAQVWEQMVPSKASADVTQDLLQHAQTSLEMRRSALVQDIQEFIQAKQKELQSLWERSVTDVKTVLESIDMVPKPVTSQLHASPAKPASAAPTTGPQNMFAKRHITNDASDLSKTMGGLSMSLSRMGRDPRSVQTTPTKPLSREVSMERRTMEEMEEQTIRKSMHSRKVMFTQHESEEDVAHEEHETGEEDHVFDIDEDLEAKHLSDDKAPAVLEPPVATEEERPIKDELATSLLHSGMATSFSAIPQTMEWQKKREDTHLRGPYDLADPSYMARTLHPQDTKRESSKAPLLHPDHDEDLALAGAALANAPSHRRMHPMPAMPLAASKNMHSASVAWRQRSANHDDTLTLARSVPSHSTMPIHKPAPQRDVYYGLDREPKTSLPYHEKRMVPSLLKAVRAQRTPSSQGLTMPTTDRRSVTQTTRTTGFRVPNTHMAAEETMQAQRSRAAPQGSTTIDLPPLPEVPSTHIRLDPSPELAPRAIENLQFTCTDTDDKTLNKLLYFMHYLQNLKLLKRTGWYHHNVPAPESIADHMYRMAVLAMLLEDDKVDVRKCVMMALVHDLAEALVGDLTPLCKVDKEDKQRRELKAIQFLTQDLLGDTHASQWLLTLWNEYEHRSSAEAKIVKDLDCFELCLQAYEYEKAHGIKDLQPFWDGAAPKVAHPEIQQWMDALLRKRRALWHTRGLSYSDST